MTNRPDGMRICPMCLMDTGLVNYVGVGHQCTSDKPCRYCGESRGAELIEVGAVGSGLLVFVDYPCGDKTCQTKRQIKPKS